MNYPELSLYPTNVTEIMKPVAQDGRPLVWDEEGIPLNSDGQLNPDGAEIRPNRNTDDYQAAQDLIGWPKDTSERWQNSGLQRHIMAALPDMLATCVEAGQHQRDILGTRDLFDYKEAFLLVEGLQKAWSLVMYGQNRLPNGALPSHLAGLQRILPGHEGLMLNRMYDTPVDVLLGNVNAGLADPDELASMILTDPSVFLTNRRTNESCPAGRIAQVAVMDCMLLPKEAAKAKHAGLLATADPHKTLADYGIKHGALSLLGSEVADVLTNPISQARVNLWLSHRMLVGDTSPLVYEHAMRQAHEIPRGQRWDSIWPDPD